VLLISPRNWNATQKPVVVLLYVARYRKMYPLLTTPPSSVLLWGSVCFFCANLRCRVSAVWWSYRSAKTNDVKEQWICIKFCFKLGKTALETHRMLKEAFGDNALGQMQTYGWFQHFRNGWMSVNDEECSWQPSKGTTTENVAKVWK